MLDDDDDDDYENVSWQCLIEKLSPQSDQQPFPRIWRIINFERRNPLSKNPSSFQISNFFLSKRNRPGFSLHSPKLQIQCPIHQIGFSPQVYLPNVCNQPTRRQSGGKNVQSNGPIVPIFDVANRMAQKTQELHLRRGDRLPRRHTPVDLLHHFRPCRQHNL